MYRNFLVFELPDKRLVITRIHLEPPAILVGEVWASSFDEAKTRYVSDWLTQQRRKNDLQIV